MFFTASQSEVEKRGRSKSVGLEFKRHRAAATSSMSPCPTHTKQRARGEVTKNCQNERLMNELRRRGMVPYHRPVRNEPRTRSYPGGEPSVEPVLGWNPSASKEQLSARENTEKRRAIMHLRLQKSDDPGMGHGVDRDTPGVPQRLVCSTSDFRFDLRNCRKIPNWYPCRRWLIGLFFTKRDN